MKPMTYLAGIFLCLGLASQLPAGYPQPCPPVVPQAPDMLGPGFHWPNYCGQFYGPAYCVHPPYLPFQGMVFPPQNGNGNGRLNSPTFPSHPFARSPRDFFMVE